MHTPSSASASWVTPHILQFTLLTSRPQQSPEDRPQCVSLSFKVGDSSGGPLVQWLSCLLGCPFQVEAPGSAPDPAPRPPRRLHQLASYTSQREVQIRS